jgi:hypothetical protein
MIRLAKMTQPDTVVRLLDSLEAYRQAHGSGQLQQDIALHLQQLFQVSCLQLRTGQSS